MKKILITGATGHLGTGVLNELLATVPAASVSVLVRDLSKAQHFAAKGVLLHKGDYNDPESLRSAFRDTDLLYFISGSEVNQRVQQHENIVRAAVDARVGHIIYTSFQRKTEDDTSPIAYVAADHIQTEKLIRASGLTYTILKHALYADLLPMFMGDMVLHTGIIFLPAGKGKASFTSRADMASAGASILTGSGHENQTYEIAVSRSYSFYDIAEILSRLFQKEIHYEAPDAATFVRELDRAGVSEDAIQTVTTFCEAISHGEFDCPTDTLEKLIGRKPEKLDVFLKQAYGI